MPSQTKRRACRAFTLVELLVSIAIIAVLISLALPALARMRQSSKEAVALANVRTVGQSFQHYADERKTWPFARQGVSTPGLPSPPGMPPIQPPPDILVVPWWPQGTIIGVSDHWALSYLWPGIISVVAPWEENYAVWVSPGRDKALPEIGDYGEAVWETVSLRYSNSFVASAKLWSPGAAADESFLRATAPADVTMPARKVMLWDADLAYLTHEPDRVGRHYRAMTPMCFADLHSAPHDPTKAAAGVPNPLNNNDASTLHNTPGGVTGSDY